MRKFTILILILACIMALIYVTASMLFVSNGRDWQNDRQAELLASCAGVNIGDPVDVVIEKMGSPDSSTEYNGMTTLLYLRGGLLTDKGMSFVFEDGKLIKSDCK